MDVQKRRTNGEDGKIPCATSMMSELLVIGYFAANLCSSEKFDV